MFLSLLANFSLLILYLLPNLTEEAGDRKGATKYIFILYLQKLRIFAVCLRDFDQTDVTLIIFHIRSLLHAKDHNPLQLYPVLCDGTFMGYIPVRLSRGIEKKLRIAKVTIRDARVPWNAEVISLFVAFLCQIFYFFRVKFSPFFQKYSN